MVTADQVGAEVSPKVPNCERLYRIVDNNISRVLLIGGHARVATIRFHSRVDIFLHVSFVLSVLNFSSVLY